jgi:Tfp pilus assembly protein PilV
MGNLLAMLAVGIGVFAICDAQAQTEADEQAKVQFHQAQIADQRLP